MVHNFFDAHCDTGTECFTKAESIRKNSLHLDLDRMKMFDGYIQVFAAFVDKKQIHCSAFDHCMMMLSFLRQELNQNKDIISVVTTEKELIQIAMKKKYGAILSIEGGEALGGSLDNLYLFYEMGVRLITLTWNYANEIADGVCEDHGGGLTTFGKKAVSAMEELGIVIDVSHLSEKGFWDVVACTKFPFVASHSNAKKLCNNPRNLTNDQIECIINRKGCIGINFFPDFLTDSKPCQMNHILQHIDYIFSLGGEDSLGFGSDFDGVSCLPDGISGIESMKDVLLAMRKRNFSEGQIRKICFGNFYRIFKETLHRRK